MSKERMNDIEHLLTCLSEEASEIIKDASKSLRFGLDDRNVVNPGGPTNRERLIDELNDLEGVLQILEERGILPSKWRNQGKVNIKKQKVAKFMEYARSVRALEQAHVPASSSNEERARTAVAAFAPEMVTSRANGQPITNEDVEMHGALNGDTLALYVWRECMGAESNNNACDMLMGAVANLERAANAAGELPDDEEDDL